MKVGVGLKPFSYSPEAYAYEKYLRLYGVDVEVGYERDINNDNDVNIFFMGLRPFWANEKGRAIEIHEYQSLSTPRFSRAKDKIKQIINKRPAGRIFLNNLVHDNLKSFNDCPFIYRDMGVDDSLYQIPQAKAEYDVLYSGSIAGRTGLISELERLASLGLKMLIVGDADFETRSYLSSKGSFYFTGRVRREELPGIYIKAKAGLNYTPDIFPFNIQTSTKTLEYLASGLLLISNRYDWINNFCAQKKVDVLWCNEIKSINSFERAVADKKGAPDMSEYRWNNILEKSDFYNFIVRLYSI